MTRLTIDGVAGVMSAHLVDGTVVTDAHPLLEDPLFPLTEYRVAEREATILTASGDSFDIEVFDGTSDVERILGRQSVYLDQNKWIAIAQYLKSPSRLRQEAADAIEAFLKLVEERELIVPMSAAHLVETGSTNGRWREDLAPLLPRLSRGWVFTDVTTMRRVELSAMLGGEISGTAAGVSLDPGQFMDGQNLAEWAGATDSSGLSAVFGSLELLSSIFGVLLYAPPVGPDQGGVASSWAGSNQRLSASLRAVQPAGAISRERTFAEFIHDLEPEILEAASAVQLSNAEVEDWIQHRAAEAVGSARYLGALRELTDTRLRNASDRWEANDLIDMNYLSCAAGYCDYVVGERKMVNLLRQSAARLPSVASLHTSFTSLMDELGAGPS